MVFSVEQLPPSEHTERVKVGLVSVGFWLPAFWARAEATRQEMARRTFMVIRVLIDRMTTIWGPVRGFILRDWVI